MNEFRVEQQPVTPANFLICVHVCVHIWPPLFTVC